MSTLFRALALAALVSAPVITFAQSNGPVTRAQVRAELVQIEAAGYNPAISNDPSYPADIQAAQAKIAMTSTSSVANASVGGASLNGSSAIGHRTSVKRSKFVSRNLWKHKARRVKIDKLPSIFFELNSFYSMELN